MREKKTPLTRSQLMGRVRGVNTKPEMIVRRLAHAIGLRFRLHRGDLPGTPDLVFPGRRTAIFVHGCFWHRHPGCHRASNPKTRPEFWNAKFERNVARDAKVERLLHDAGWDVLIIWECETRDQLGLEQKLMFLKRNASTQPDPLNDQTGLRC